MSADQAALAARVQAIEDRFAIQDLVAEYCRALDDRDLAGFIGLFTVDGVIRHDDDVMRLEGRAAIEAYYTARFRQYGVTFHYPHAHTVTFDGPDHASGVVTGHAEMGLDGAAWLAAFRYHDRYARDAGRWRFRERRLACWYYMRLTDLPERLTATLRKHYRGQWIAAELPESTATYRALHGLE